MTKRARPRGVAHTQFHEEVAGLSDAQTGSWTRRHIREPGR